MGAWSCTMQIASAKNCGAKGTPCHQAVTVSCSTPGDTCLLCLHSGWVYLGVAGVIVGNKDAKWIQIFLFVSDVDQGDEEVGWIQHFTV